MALGVVRVATTVTGYRELRVYQLSDYNSLGEGTSGLGPAADPPPGRSVRSTAIIEPLYRWTQHGITGASPAHGTRSGRQPGEA